MSSTRRQKSCLRCARHKLRCDRHKPRCGRCADADAECDYSQRAEHSVSGNRAEPSESDGGRAAKAKRARVGHAFPGMGTDSIAGFYAYATLGFNSTSGDSVSGDSVSNYSNSYHNSYHNSSYNSSYPNSGYSSQTGYPAYTTSSSSSSSSYSWLPGSLRRMFPVRGESEPIPPLAPRSNAHLALSNLLNPAVRQTIGTATATRARLTLHPSRAVPLPLPISAFSSPLPDSDVLNSLVSTFWRLLPTLGRGTVLSPPHHRQTRTEGGPLFWSVLWGGLLLSPDDNDNAAAATTVVGFRRGITDRARAVLVASIVEASAWVESAVEPRHLAAKIVPVLQSLVLGILYAEREGEGGVMLGLTGIAVRLAKGAVGALKGWIREISRSRSRSSTASCESGLETTIADSEGERSLLAQFSASFWFIAGSEIWCADLLGTPFSITDHEIACVPIAFDAANGGLLPIVGAEVVLALLNPETGAERRREILREMVGGILETGPHFLAGVQLLIEKRTIELRRRAAAELGFSDLYAARGTEVGMEATRLTGVLQEAVDALPLQIRDLEASGRISDLLALLRACPAIPESMVHLTSAAMLWNNQHQACIRSPALGIEPDDDDGWWTGDGAEAGGFAVRGARYLASLINAGYDPNSNSLLRWFHTRIDRLAHLLHALLGHARKHGSPSVPLLSGSLEICLLWFSKLRGRVRYTEWMERLAKDTVDLWGGEVSTVDTGLIEFGGGQMDVGGTLRSLVEGGRGE